MTPKQREASFKSESIAALAKGQPVPHLLNCPHHDGSEIYVSKDVPRLGEIVPVRVRVPSSFLEDDVHVRVLRDGEPVYIPAKPDGKSEGER